MKKLFMIATIAGALLSNSILFANAPISIHWLYSRSPNLIELEDRSLWEISNSDSRTVETWKKDDPLVITPNNSWFGSSYYDCYITNVKTNTSVPVHIKEGPERRGAFSHWIAEINQAGGLTLENNTHWQIDPRDRSILDTKYWCGDDAIIIILQDNRHTYYYDEEFDYILFNINRNSKVRARQR